MSERPPFAAELAEDERPAVVLHKKGLIDRDALFREAKVIWARSQAASP